MAKTILILGGYGNAGRLIAEHLLQETNTDVRLVLAGRNLSRAQELAISLNEKHPGARVTTERVDASVDQDLDTAFDKVDMVIVASSTVAYAETVVRAAIRAKIDYLDLMPRKPRKLQELKDEIERAGCCVVTDGGCHPGLPAALVRYAAKSCTSLTKAVVYILLQPNWKPIQVGDGTVQEMVSEFMKFEAKVYEDKGWKQSSWTNMSDFDFGPPFGTRGCIPMFLEELETLPTSMTGLSELSCRMAGLNWVTDMIVTPLCFISISLLGKWALGPAGKLLEWSLKTFSKPPYGNKFVVDAAGTERDIPVQLRLSVSHEDAYEITAMPVVAAVLQMLAKPQPGLHFQAQFVEPDRFVKDMKRMGLAVELEKKLEADIKTST